MTKNSVKKYNKRRNNIKPKSKSISDDDQSETTTTKNNNRSHNNNTRYQMFLLGVVGVIVALLYSKLLNRKQPSAPGTNTQEVKLEARIQKETSSELNKNTETTMSSTRTTSLLDERIIDDGGGDDDAIAFISTVANKFEVRNIKVDGRELKPVSVFNSTSGGSNNNKKKTSLSSSSVQAFVFDNFLSDMECDGLLRAHAKHVSEKSPPPIICFDSIETASKHIKNAAGVVADAGISQKEEEEKKNNILKQQVSDNDFTKGTLCFNESLSRDFGQLIGQNWSYSTAFYPGESKFSNKFADRVFQATGLKQSHGGKFQITSYPQGIGYKDHTDCIVVGSSSSSTTDKRDRFATMLVYLQDVEKGGETVFPELNITIKPKKGQALVWTNMEAADGICDPTSVHRAAKVIHGQKTILQRWYYYKNFHSLHHRPKAADIPKRDPNVAMVSCDKYEEGSCRWYDEWGYSHIKEYLMLQRSLM